MALVKCKECGHDVSTTADACPNCGAKMKASHPQYKKNGCGTLIFALFVGAIVVAALQSNSDDTSGTGSKTKTTASTDSGPSKAECQKTLGCWGERNLIDAEVRCEDPVERLAKYQYKWTDGFLEQKFDRYAWLNKKKHTVTYFGDKIKFQNGFGAWQIMSYSCDYDPATKRVLNVSASPGRLPALKN